MRDERTKPPPLPPKWQGAETWLRATWNAAADAIAISGPDGVVQLANPAYFQLFGYRPDEVLGRSFSIIFPEEARPAAEVEYRAIFEGLVAAPRVEATVRRADGTELTVEARVDFVVQDGIRLAMINVIRDITERKRAEAERERLLAAEQRARADVEAAVRLRDQVLAAVTHDVKTPLAAIRGHAQLLRRIVGRLSGPEAARLAVSARQIEVATDKLARWIDQLNDVAQLQIGQPLVLQRTAVDLVALARQVVEEHRQRSVQPSLRVTAVAAVDQSVGQWDFGRIERVVDNLVANAIKYSPSGGEVRVAVAEERRHGQTWAVLRVSDEGIGIPPADLAHVFEPFYRGQNVAETITGTGIGLASARQIVEQHGGSIEVESEPGRGSTFTVRLPLAPPP